MRDDKFLKRLNQELPHWIKSGWLSADAGQAIVADLSARRQSAGSHLTLAFSIMGALLLAAGVILFFAANWSALPKLAKLGILFGALLLAYGAAGYFQARAPKLSEALLLLAVLLFGANIFLIAQIYHIDSHYPNGVLLWALGALLCAYLLDSQPALIAAVALATLWTGMESLDFQQRVHWPYLLLLAAALLPVLRNGWKVALRCALIGLLLWSAFTFVRSWDGYDARLSAPLYFLQVCLLCYLSLYAGGRILAGRLATEAQGVIVANYAVFGALLSFFGLTFTFQRWRDAESTAFGLLPGAASWLAVWLIALAVLGYAIAAYRKSSVGRISARNALIALALLSGLLIVMALNFVAPAQLRGPIAIAANLLYFASLIWLVYVGIEAGDRALVNAAFLFFGLGLISRYLDTFWTLLDRSLYFMLGGALLLGGGYVLEKQRRKLTAGLAPGR